MKSIVTILLLLLGTCSIALGQSGSAKFDVSTGSGLGLLGKLVANTTVVQDFQELFNTLQNGTDQTRQAIQSAFNQTLINGNTTIANLTIALQQLQKNLQQLNDTVSANLTTAVNNLLKYVQNNQQSLQTRLDAIEADIVNRIKTKLEQLRSNPLIAPLINEIYKALNNGSLNQTITNIAAAFPENQTLSFDQILQIFSQSPSVPPTLRSLIKALQLLVPKSGSLTAPSLIPNIWSTFSLPGLPEFGSASSNTNFKIG